MRLKTQEIVEETGKDIPTRLLYAVARSREDGVMLAIQLTDEKERSRNLAAELAISRKEVAKGEEARAAAMELLEAKERSILSLQAASTSLQRNFDKLQAQFDDSRKELNAKAEQCEGFRSELDKSRQAEEAARAEMAEAEARAAQREKDLRAELVGALERESASAAEDKRMAGEAIQSLESQLTSTQRDLREAEYSHQQAVLEIERQQVALREQEERIQGILLHADSKEQALKEDLKALDAHCSVLNEKCSGLADELASSRSDVSFQQQKAEEAGRRAKRSDGVLEEEEKKWQEERGRMMGKLEDALVQLSAAIEKSDRVEREAAAARSECKVSRLVVYFWKEWGGRNLTLFFFSLSLSLYPSINDSVCVCLFCAAAAEGREDCPDASGPAADPGVEPGALQVQGAPSEGDVGAGERREAEAGSRREPEQGAGGDRLQAEGDREGPEGHDQEHEQLPTGAACGGSEAAAGCGIGGRAACLPVPCAGRCGPIADLWSPGGGPSGGDHPRPRGSGGRKSPLSLPGAARGDRQGCDQQAADAPVCHEAQVPVTYSTRVRRLFACEEINLSTCNAKTPTTTDVDAVYP